MKPIVSLWVIAGFAVLGFSCRGMAQAIGDSADEMGDSRGARALSQSARSIERALEDITPEQEYYIGRAVGANLLTNYALYQENQDLVLYLNEITAAVAINSKKPEIFNGYHTMVLDSAEINAFSTSGGHIFITRGLLDCASSEDTLAAVIAHEIAHIQLQHSIMAIKSNRVINALATTGSSLAGLALSDLTEILDEAANDIVSAMQEGYSQNQEFAADTLALELLADTGYEPSSLAAMLRVLEQTQSRRPGGLANGLARTHPSPEDRIAQLERPLRQYKDAVRDTRSYREARFSTAQ
ncbi:MAG: M48 family metallopeptidase [Treponema sp.]|jgi:predicted Zn-dependent protease|nr:M48 family metallopeptidase [Treponema sp.]